MIEKLAKEFEKIRTSLTKSKKIILADIDKIDEKYRRLAQEEKKSLTEGLGVLNEQLKYYDNLLGGSVSESSDTELPLTTEGVTPEEPKEEVEEKIQDTIFPENNEEVEKEETEQPVKDLDAEEDADWEDKIKSGELKPVEKTREEPKEGMTLEEVEAKLEAAGFTKIEEPVETAETKEEFGDIWPEESEEKPEPKVMTDDDNWPEMPQEWN